MRRSILQGRQFYYLPIRPNRYRPLTLGAERLRLCKYIIAYREETYTIS